MDNLDETKHPNSNGHQKWVSYLNEKIGNLVSHITIEENILKSLFHTWMNFLKIKILSIRYLFKSSLS